jgi:diphosphomevalonate decarboxylase
MLFNQISAKSWEAKAFANIALIKYMGKISQGNAAANSSLSYASPAFFSRVDLTVSEHDYYVNDDNKLGASEVKRFLRHLQYIKSYYGFDGCFAVGSKNSFPASCGIASSASSFAALTLCAASAIATISGQKPPAPDVLASLSRVGSGSSCRSFHGSWALWRGDKVSAIEFSGLSLEHFVVVVSDKKKPVSSSAAHARVISSSLFEGRRERAEQRITELIPALSRVSWAAAFDLVWAEFWDMHALFETSMPSFGYLLPSSIYVLNFVRDFWHEHGDGPLVTVDAGPNIHLLFRDDQGPMRKIILAKLQCDYLVLGSQV